MADPSVSILVQQLERTRTIWNGFWCCSSQSITEMQVLFGWEAAVEVRGRTEGRQHWGHHRAQEHSWGVGAGICLRAQEDKYVLIYSWDLLRCGF